MTTVVILGAGFGGLEISSRLSAELGDSVDVVLIDRGEGFVFGFSKLDVMFGRTPADHARLRYADITKPGVRFVRAEVTAIDPVARRVETSAGAFDADYLVVALGADLAPERVPGLVEDGNEFYSVAGAFAARDVLESFAGGRVVVGVAGSPFKCPPAPSETALLTHDYLTRRGLREVSEISLVMPLPVPVPPSPDASAALLDAFAERGIAWVPQTVITALDTERKVAVCADGTELPYDLFLAVPPHCAPAVVVESGLTTDGWIPVDYHTLRTEWPGVWAVGDVTSVGTPKAGVFAEGQAVVVADQLVAAVRGVEPESEYHGEGACYLEFGADRIARVDIVFPKGDRPHGRLTGPSADLVADKELFGSSRAQRWFDVEWQPVRH